MRAVDPERILQMRAESHSLQQIAETLGVGYGTVRARLQKALAENPDKKRPRKRLEKDT
jgi:DNA-directed RNA polymerase specialized sigma24 family protein